MSLTRCRDLLDDFFRRNLPNVRDVQIGIENDTVKVVCKNLTFKGHDDDIYFTINISMSSGALPYEVLMGFTFDKLRGTLDDFELINRFNTKAPFFVGSITPKGFFKVQWHFVMPTPEDAIAGVARGLKAILNMNDSDDLLKQITRRTM